MSAGLPAGRVHFVGVGGIHMSALAGLVLDAGGTVSGSDLTSSPLTEALAARGATITIGHEAAHVRDSALVVRTIAVPESNPEIVAAAQDGIEMITRAQMVARLSTGRRVLAVAGSHGKTTVATMLTLILRDAGRDAGYILGGESPDLPGHAAWGTGPMVLEADEYGRAFHHYHPSVAVITNIEADHLDYYGDAVAVADSFAAYARTLEPDGRLIVGGESACATRVADQAAAERPDITVRRFGAGPFEWRMNAIQEDRDGASAEVVHDGKVLGAISLRVPGLHNLVNALAALAASSDDVPFEAAQRALARFRGVRRRFQVLGEAAGVTVIDDYAHHPTEIRATVAAATTRYAGRRLVVLFQPHTYSRTAYLLDGFRSAFHGVGRLLIAETYAARETPDAGMAAIDLVPQIEKPLAEYGGPLDDAAEAAASLLQSGDVFIAMGAGDVERAGPAVLERLRAR
jgi:UDP-N-acetylmuramate--alanine ligase